MSASKIFMEQAENYKRKAQQRRYQGDTRGAQWAEDEAAALMIKSAQCAAQEMAKAQKEQQRELQRQQAEFERQQRDLERSFYRDEHSSGSCVDDIDYGDMYVIKSMSQEESETLYEELFNNESQFEKTYPKMNKFLNSKLGTAIIGGGFILGSMGIVKVLVSAGLF